MAWVRACSENAAQIERFLRKHEAVCIHLCETYIRNAGNLLQKGGFLIKTGTSGIESLIGTDLKGHLYPFFRKKPEEHEMKLISGYLGRIGRIVSVMGVTESVNLISPLLHKRLYRQIDYDLMQEGSTPLPGRKSALDIQRMTIRDIPKVYPLQEGYEKEEVLLNPGNFNRGASLMLFQKRMKQYPHFIGKYKGAVVSMARINAMSWNIYQIGGVYTLPDMRSRGFAEDTMRFTLEEIHRKGRTGLLFVKKKNVPALRLYNKLCFSRISDFSIAYFS